MATGNRILTIKINEKNCPENISDCGMWIAILAINGRLIDPPE